MYIYKMVYAESNAFSDEDFRYLQQQDLIRDTDYGTTEILADDIQNSDNISAKEMLKDGLGTEVYDLLMNGGLDLVMIAY